MAATVENLSSEESSPAEEWTIVLPRRGKKNRNFGNSGVPIQQKEEQSWTPIDTEADPARESKLMQKMQFYFQKLEVSDFFSSFLEQMQNPDMLNRFLKVLGSEEKMQMGRRQVQKPTLFFMPHCEADLYENLLEVNWVMDRLIRLVLFGNSFGSYD